jgi:hypothetical protein
LFGTLSVALILNNPGDGFLFWKNKFLLPALDEGSMDPKRRYLSFDIETAKVLPEDESDLKSHRPLGISCAATILTGDNEPVLWHGGDQMTRDEAADLVRYLKDRTREGYTLLTWNGVGFDLDILAEESGMLETCRRLATDHVDMMFQVLCLRGFGVSLDAAARGMNIKGKPEGMTGSRAPVLWAEGKREEVLQYVGQDVRTTLDVALACESVGALRWVSRKGKLRTMRLLDGWLTVSEAGKLPLPDTSWMDEPWPREEFTAWMQAPPSEPPVLPVCQFATFDIGRQSPTTG